MRVKNNFVPAILEELWIQFFLTSSLFNLMENQSHAGLRDKRPFNFGTFEEEQSVISMSALNARVTTLLATSVLR